MAGKNTIEIVVKAVTQGQGEVKGISTTIEGLDVSLQKVTDSLKRQGLQLAAAVVSFSAIKSKVEQAVQTFAGFDDAMRTVAAVSGATGEEFNKMTELARKMGEQTRFTAQESATAMKFLAMAGLDASEAMEALPHTLNLAAAGAIDLGRAADLLTNIMTGYGLEASELAKVNDVLVATFTNSNSNLEELAQGFKYVGPVAKSLGIEIEETSAILGTLASSGYKAEQGGAALRNIFLALIAPTSNAGKMFEKLGVDTKEFGLNLSDQASALKSLGVEIKDSVTGNMRPFADILADIKTGLSQFGDETTKAGIVAQIFGKRAVGPMLSLISQGGDTIRDFSNEIKNSGGVAAQIATQMESGLGGALRRLRSLTESNAITLGESLAPTVEKVAKSTMNLTQALTLTAGLQFGGMVSDFMSIADSMDNISAKSTTALDNFTTWQRLSIGIAVPIAIIRDTMTAISVLAQEIVIWIKESEIAMAETVAVTEGMRETVAKAKEQITGMRSALQDSLEGSTTAYEQLAKTIADMQEGNLKASLANQQAGEKNLKQLEQWRAAVRAGTMDQEVYNAKVAALIEAQRTAAEVGTAGAEKVRDLQTEAANATDQARVSAEALATAQRNLATDSEKVKTGLTDAGKAGVEAFKTIAAAAGEAEEITKKYGIQAGEIFVALADQATVTGQVIIQAFSSGLNTAQTISDVNELTIALEQAFLAGTISAQQMDEGWNLSRQKLGELTAAALAAATDLGTLRKVFQEIEQVSINFGDVLKEELIGSLEKLGTADLSRLQAQMAILFDEGIADARMMIDVSDGIANVLSSRLGIAARDFATGITYATSESIDALRLLGQQANVTGDMLYQALTAVTAKAQTVEDIEAIRTALDEMASTGKLTMEQIAVAGTILEKKFIAINAGSAEAVLSLQNLAEAQREFNAALAAGDFGKAIEGAEKLKKAIENALDKGEVSGDDAKNKIEEVDDKLKQAKETTDDLGESAENTGEKAEEAGEKAEEAGKSMGEAFSFTLRWSDKILRSLEELGVEFDDLFASVEHLVQKDIFGTITNFDTMNRNMERALDILRDGMEQFNSIMEKGSQATQRDVDLAQRLLDTFGLLDEATLQNLQAEVDDLTESLGEAKNAAEDLIEDLKMDLLRLADDQAAIELARFEAEMEKLRKLMEEAQTIEIRRLYAEAMRLEEEKHRQIMENIDAESAARSGEQEQTVDDTRSRTTTEEIERVTENIVYDQRQITYVWNVPYETTEDFVRDTVVPILDQIAEGEA